ncbi:EF-hand domain-containing protein [Streptomyces sp. NBC_00237]|uniref:EF-hand domain-containing protein n=1 Tax=Streptomyces sp. NBC_00237 TaxID=2975687 RepID=UPI0022591C1A|nr:EF-hand domain-containing protein [Streptomyces sp. NBC_00237]MCX5205672.1 EF-hand domain-containing protein [Streptomyces sp. NBC_00237]
MTTDAILRKYDLIFDRLDADGSGVLEFADCERMGEEVIRSGHVPADSAKATALFSAYREGWDRLVAAADADGDGRITREEFRAAMTDTLGRREQVVSGCRAVLDAEFSAIDKDDDGLVPVADFQRYLEALGSSPEEAAATCSLMDANHDGQVSRNEFHAGWEQYLLSDELSEAGSSFLGSLA